MEFIGGERGPNRSNSNLERESGDRDREIGFDDGERGKGATGSVAWGREAGKVSVYDSLPRGVGN